MQKMLSPPPKPQTRKSMAFHALAFSPWHYDRMIQISIDGSDLKSPDFKVKPTSSLPAWQHTLEGVTENQNA